MWPRQPPRLLLKKAIWKDEHFNALLIPPLFVDSAVTEWGESQTVRSEWEMVLILCRVNKQLNSKTAGLSFVLAALYDWFVLRRQNQIDLHIKARKEIVFWNGLCLQMCLLWTEGVFLGGGKWLCSDSSFVVSRPLNHLTLPGCRCTSTRGQSAVQLQLNVTLPDYSPESCRRPDEGCWCRPAGSLHQLGLIRL